MLKTDNLDENMNSTVSDLMDEGPGVQKEMYYTGTSAFFRWEYDIFRPDEWGREYRRNCTTLGLMHSSDGNTTFSDLMNVVESTEGNKELHDIGANAFFKWEHDIFRPDEWGREYRRNCTTLGLMHSSDGNTTFSDLMNVVESTEGNKEMYYIGASAFFRWEHDIFRPDEWGREYRRKCTTLGLVHSSDGNTTFSDLMDVVESTEGTARHRG
ncbi:hypothetical protein J6590_019906 [Homalodisca vitripennis]|nr:hypothetical protein J6590_019906 [Homalodisca vitripennis]